MDLNLIAGLATLIVLELVLGIDNLVFVAILAGKLPPHRRDRARVVGLGLALAMRLLMLAGAAGFMRTAGRPAVSVLGLEMSWRDVVLFAGGVFLLVKATHEIHRTLEGGKTHETTSRRTPSFTVTIVQIVVLDAIFSADAVITAVGMVESLWVMMAAVIVSMAIMIAASKPLTAFVTRHPTVIVLCLCFLLLIGCSLMVEALGIHVPKTYLYAAIGFSLFIETLNQVGVHRRRRSLMSMPSRERAAEVIERLLSPGPGGGNSAVRTEEPSDVREPIGELPPDESGMIRGIMSLSSLPVRAIMTLRPEIVWLKADSGIDAVRDALIESGRSRVLLCGRDLDDVLGVIDVRAALRTMAGRPDVDVRTLAERPMYVMRTMTTSRLTEEMRRRDERFAIVTDAQGAIEGVVTTMDVFAVIAGDLADDEDDDLIEAATDDGMTVRGLTRIADIENHFGRAIGRTDRNYETVAGHLLEIAGCIPARDDRYDDAGLRFTVIEVDGRRIEKVDVRRIGPEDDA